jgi:hypothetical protein
MRARLIRELDTLRINKATQACVARLKTTGAKLNDFNHGRSNNSFNRSGIHSPFIVNLSHDAVDSRPVNSGVMPHRLCSD